MSRNNKVNPDHYTMAGRLTPDELARQRRQQDEQLFGRGRRRQRALPPWMTNEPARNRGANDLVAASQGEQPRESDASGEDAQTALRDGTPAANHKGRGGHLASTRPAAAKASGAGGTRKTRKAASTRGSAARGSSSQRAAKPAARKGRAKGVGTTRQKQRKGGSNVSRRAALTRRKR